jgi:aerobic-type carbon monoxide dehydrogenase small subunit (CoxS/CutS family)
VTVVVNGVPRRVSSDVTLAAGLLNLGIWAFRRDLSGAPRAPLCGMGTCHECRVTVDGVQGARACLLSVRDGMRIETGS